MHDVTNVTTGVKIETPRRLTLAQLARELRDGSATDKALIDFDLRFGLIEISGGLPADMSRSVTGIPRGYQCTMRGLGPQERLRLRSGWATISDYHNKRTVSDRKIEAFIRKAGPAQVLAALDRLTAPAAAA
jgi:hypothetical protein